MRLVCSVTGCISLVWDIHWLLECHLQTHTHTLATPWGIFFFHPIPYHTLMLLFIVCHCLYTAVNTHLPMFWQQWPTERQSVWCMCCLCFGTVTLVRISCFNRCVSCHCSHTLIKLTLPVGFKCQIILWFSYTVWWLEISIPALNFLKNMSIFSGLCVRFCSAWLHRLLGWLTDLATERLSAYWLIPRVASAKLNNPHQGRGDEACSEKTSIEFFLNRSMAEKAESSHVVPLDGAEE